MVMQKIMDMSNYQEEENNNTIIQDKLFDGENPEMITKVASQEVDKFSNLWVLTQFENRLRHKLKIPSSSMITHLIKYNLKLRTSINGWRAEQGQKILTHQTEDALQQKDDLQKNVAKILGGNK